MSDKLPKLRFYNYSEEWERVNVKELSSEIYGGGTPKTSIKEYWLGEIPWIQSSDLNIDELHNVVPSKYITDEAVKESAAKLVPRGSIAIVTRVGVGKLSVIPYDYCTSQDFLSLSSLKVDINFGAYSLYKLLDKEKNNLQGTSIKGITKRDLLMKKIAISRSDIEQQKIGEFFKQLDDRIALQQSHVEQLKQSKQGFLQKMFPKDGESVPEVRFDGFSEEWKNEKAKSIFKSISEKNQSTLPVLSASQEKGMIYRNDVGIDIKYDMKSTKNYKRVKPGQFVIHLRSFQGGFAYSSIEGITSPAYTVIDFNNSEDYSPLFWRIFLSSKKFIKRLETVTYGIRDGRSISYRDFSTLKLKFPSVEEQQKIGEFFKQLDDLIAKNERELELLQETKKGFLQKMFV